MGLLILRLRLFVCLRSDVASREMSRAMEQISRLEATLREKDRIITELQARSAALTHLSSSSTLSAPLPPPAPVAAAAAAAPPSALKPALKVTMAGHSVAAAAAAAAALPIASVRDTYSAGAVAVPRFAQPTASSQASQVLRAATTEKENESENVAGVRFAAKPTFLEEQQQQLQSARGMRPPQPQPQSQSQSQLAVLSPLESRRNTRAAAMATDAPTTPSALKTREQLLQDYLSVRCHLCDR